uniref:Photosystem I reaction center subunit PsaK n=1 Tax=Cyanidium caldarium TaxID=2771 RepID=PSAK_CYACA|nr:photosystem I subunit X [Cyanidium caldarium]O19902.1 RecName: Full=Photosystem I reaction center subunit PsaK; AltName: Full=PSI-K; AltName: Full=Photosystem I subunit X [Cyanidium caldarium]AAB82687.1 unknown [Cyanidium caldarium]WDB00201.1 photosystem I subunit X [Cyanidium caldarium]
MLASYLNLFNTPWNSSISIIMILSNIMAIVVGRYSIKVRGLKPPIAISQLKDFGVPELLATMSLGHIIGVGSTIGLKTLNFITY